MSSLKSNILAGQSYVAKTGFTLTIKHSNLGNMITEPRLFVTEPHCIRIAHVRAHAQKILDAKLAAGKPASFSKQEKATIEAGIELASFNRIHSGVDFSRATIGAIFRQQDAGIGIEFETMGPYMADYTAVDGAINLERLTPEDAIGLRLAQLFRSLFPKARLVSLYDDYNNRKITQAGQKQSAAHFTAVSMRNFYKNLEALFRDQGVILPSHAETKDFLLLSERTKVDDAEKLVEELEMRGYIVRKDKAIHFVNDDAENPLYRQVCLRAQDGRWLCEALDAASFLKKENLAVIHIIVLPSYMLRQQDKVWEILRVLGIQPARYQNIFFDATAPPQAIVDTIAQAFVLSRTRQDDKAVRQNTA